MKCVHNDETQMFTIKHTNNCFISAFIKTPQSLLPLFWINFCELMQQSKLGKNEYSCKLSFNWQLETKCQTKMLVYGWFLLWRVNEFAALSSECGMQTVEWISNGTINRFGVWSYLKGFRNVSFSKTHCITLSFYEFIVGNGALSLISNVWISWGLVCTNIG